MESQLKNRATVRFAAHTDMEAVCSALAAGFDDDPLFQYMFPSEERRRLNLPRFFAPYVRLALACGKVRVIQAVDGDDGASICGAAVTFEPEFYPGSLRHSHASAAELDEQVYEASGVDALTAVAAMDALTAHHPKAPPHQYLLFIAVRPERRGCGYGALLMQSMAAEWDAAGQPGYLEATTDRSTTGFYHRHGWQPFAAPFNPANAPVVFPLWRNADVRL
ncbi:GNAT family N-acetyltransferase [Ciceribacter sp. RN22]|nr:GNAT family N-acetyltransferase [Ciceribacter sp. RN22]